MEHYAKLKELCDLKKGKKVNTTKQKTSGAVPYLLINTLRGIPATEFTTDTNFTKAIPDDILIVGDGANSGLIGTGLRGAVGSTIIRIRLRRKDLRKDYVSYFLKSKFVELNSDVKGAAIPHLKTKEMLELKIRFPTETEQQLIVAEIEKHFTRLDAAIENLQTIKKKLEVYRKSVLKASFNGSFTEEFRKENNLTDVSEAIKEVRDEHIKFKKTGKKEAISITKGHSALSVGNPETEGPEGWLWVKLGEIAKMATGHTPSRNHPEYWGGDIPWIAVKDAGINDGKIITKTEQHTNKLGIENSSAVVLPKGTVCLSRTGSIIGYCVITGSEMATSQSFINWICSKAINSRWLQLLFKAEIEFLYQISEGTTHPCLYYPQVKAFYLCLPPIEEQDKIVEVIESQFSVIDKLEETVEASLLKAETLRKSILKSAFEGKLVEVES